MRIAYVTTYDAREVRHWSGLGFHIARALEEQGLELVRLGPIDPGAQARLITRARSLYFRRIRRRGYFGNHDVLMARRYARWVDRALAARPDIDLIFSPGTIPIAFVRDPRPLAFWSDATHDCLFDFYREYTGLSDKTVRDGHAIERAALARARAAIFSSDWAARSALDHYGADPSCVHVVPLAANLDAPPARAEVETAIAARQLDRCRLLFLGVDWERKGGPLALDVAAGLNAAGLPTELTIVGCQPSGYNGMPPFVRVEGFLAKDEPGADDRLRALLESHHFLILPSTAECFGLAYCEAAAHGMPALARRVGGVPTIVRDGVNGRLFDPAAGPAPYVEAVRALFADRAAYTSMARAARDAYETHFNWDVAGRRAADILRACLEAPAPRP